MKIAILKQVGKIGEPMLFAVGDLRKQRLGPWMARVTDDTLRPASDPAIASLAACREGVNSDIIRTERWSGKVVVR